MSGYPINKPETVLSHHSTTTHVLDRLQMAQIEQLPPFVKSVIYD